MKRTREKTQVERVRLAKMLDELKADGMTQTDFASSVGITQSFVSNLRAGKSALSVSLAKDIERAFPKYRAVWLLGLEEMTASKVDAHNSKIDALKVLNPMVSAMSPERREALLEYVQDFIDFNIRREFSMSRTS